MNAATEATVRRLEIALALIENEVPLPLAVRLGTDDYVTKDGQEIPLAEWEREEQRVTVSIVWEE